jgi:peptidoglycan/xylan/chitin deacetylase (PgdA/CDA1 family)
MFFATSSGLEAEREGVLRLYRYLRAGHMLANHGHAHLALSTTPLSDYLADLDRATELLRAFEGVAPFFRHPYLDEGTSRATHREINSALAQRGLRRGHVTVATYDFYLQRLMDEALASGNLVDLDTVREIKAGHARSWETSYYANNGIFDQTILLLILEYLNLFGFLNKNCMPFPFFILRWNAMGKLR